MSNDEQKISDQIDGGQLAMKEAEKQQTAMQEMIERIDKLLENHVDAGLLTCREIAVQLLPKEREQHEKIWDKGVEWGDANCSFEGETRLPRFNEYYAKTFNR